MNDDEGFGLVGDIIMIVCTIIAIVGFTNAMINLIGTLL